MKRQYIILFGYPIGIDVKINNLNTLRLSSHFILSCVDSVYVKLNIERNDAIKLYLLTVHNADRPLQDAIYGLT